MTDREIDVAIVGGGIGGLYTGWRLRGGAPNARSGNADDLRNPMAVEVFELSDRVGGRLISLDPPEMTGLKAEFGGMRYLTNQPLVCGLVEHLGLANRPFPVSGDENIYYVRGHHLRHAEFADADRVPYALSWRERGRTPGELIMEAIDMIIPGAADLTEAQWGEVQASYQFEGRHLWELGFWNLLAQVMSSEAFKFILEAGGYDTTVTNWNAAEALPWYLADFGPQVEYRTLHDGMESLPLAIAADFEARGGVVNTDHRLDSFSRLDDGRVRLTFHDGRPPVIASRLVLALPRRAMELLDDDNEFLRDPATSELLSSVTPHPMFKLFLCYRYPWWQDAGVTNGRSVTDLPLRQVYYFGSEATGPSASNRELRDSLLMASYDDGGNVGFWRGLADRGHSTTHCFPPSHEPRWNRYACPPGMIEHAQRQLRLVHDVEYIPEPYAAGFQDWGQDPYGGAWHSWNIHVRAWEVREQLRQPQADWPVHIVGEAYSDAQGWIEGALRSSEDALAAMLGG